MIPNRPTRNRARLRTTANSRTDFRATLGSSSGRASSTARSRRGSVSISSARDTKSATRAASRHRADFVSSKHNARPAETRTSPTPASRASMAPRSRRFCMARSETDIGRRSRCARQVPSYPTRSRPPAAATARGDTSSLTDPSIGTLEGRRSLRSSTLDRSSVRAREFPSDGTLE